MQRLDLETIQKKLNSFSPSPQKDSEEFTQMFEAVSGLVRERSFSDKARGGEGRTDFDYLNLAEAAEKLQDYIDRKGHPFTRNGKLRKNGAQEILDTLKSVDGFEEAMKLYRERGADDKTRKYPEAPKLTEDEINARFTSGRALYGSPSADHLRSTFSQMILSGLRGNLESSFQTLSTSDQRIAAQIYNEEAEKLGSRAKLPLTMDGLNPGTSERIARMAAFGGNTVAEQAAARLAGQRKQNPEPEPEDWLPHEEPVRESAQKRPARQEPVRPEPVRPAAKSVAAAQTEDNQPVRKSLHDRIADTMASALKPSGDDSKEFQGMVSALTDFQTHRSYSKPASVRTDEDFMRMAAAAEALQAYVDKGDKKIMFGTGSGRTRYNAAKEILNELKQTYGFDEAMAQYQAGKNAPVAPVSMPQDQMEQCFQKGNTVMSFESLDKVKGYMNRIVGLSGHSAMTKNLADNFKHLSGTEKQMFVQAYQEAAESAKREGRTVRSASLDSFIPGASELAAREYALSQSRQVQNAVRGHEVQKVSFSDLMKNEASSRQPRPEHSRSARKQLQQSPKEIKAPEKSGPGK